MRLIGRRVARRPGGVALAVAACGVSGGIAFAQGGGSEAERAALTIGAFVDVGCAQAWAAGDTKALDAIAEQTKALIDRNRKNLADAEAELKNDQAVVQHSRERYRDLQVRLVMAEEALEKAQNAGQPAVATAPLHTRIANVKSELKTAEVAIFNGGMSLGRSESRARVARGAMGLARVATRAVEICVEKRRAELATPPAVVSAPAAPDDPLAPPFALSGTWGGACDQGTKVNGTFRVAVAKGGAVSGQYAYSGGGSPGPLSGTLGPDGRLAVGSGDTGFSVRWVGSVVASGGKRSGSGTWSGGSSSIKCGGSWSSPPPA